jgi:hypothetical protein
VNPLRTAFVVILTALSAHAAVRVTPEVAVANPVPAPQEGEQYPGMMATDGDQFFNFWSGSTGLNVAHVGADGQVVSRFTVPESGAALNISAVWTGSVYLASWNASFQDLVVATFSREGNLRSGPTAVAHYATTRTGALASNGRGALLLYTIQGSDVRGTLFNADGSPIQTAIPIPAYGIATNLVDIVPFAASDGDEYAVVWRTGEQIPIVATATGSVTTQSIPPPLRELMHDFYLLRVGDDGAVIGAPIKLGRVEQTGNYGVAFGGGVYALVANESHLIKPGQTQPRLVRFIVGARNNAVTRLPTIDIDGGPSSVYWSGNSFIAYWMQYLTSAFVLKTLPFRGDAEATAPEPRTSLDGTPAALTVAFASNGRNAFGAWIQNTTPTNGLGSAIYGALFDVNATAAASGAPRLLSVGWSRQVLPAVATSGTDSLVIWMDESTGYESGRLLGARVAASGAVIDTTPFEIATSVSQYNTPRVVFAGNAYFAVWGELNAKDSSRSIVARTIGRDASLGARIFLGDGNGLTAASNGTTILVVVNNSHLSGYRFDALGHPIDTTPLVIADSYRLGPVVASNGTDFFVAWNEGSDYWQWPSANRIDVLGKRVSASGSVEAAALPIATGPSDQILAAVASDGRDYLIAYLIEDYPHSVVAAKRVLQVGQLDGAAGTDDGAVILRDASAYDRDRTSFALTGEASGYWCAFNQTLESSAILRLDPRGNPVSAPISFGGSWSWPALVPTIGQGMRIAYTRTVSDGAYAGARRVFVRSAGEPPTPRSRAAR